MLNFLAFKLGINSIVSSLYDLLLAFIIISLTLPLAWYILTRTDKATRIKNFAYKNAQRGVVLLQNLISKYDIVLAWLTLFLSLLILFIRYEIYVSNISEVIPPNRIPDINNTSITIILSHTLEAIHLFFEIIIPMLLVLLSFLKIVERSSDPMKVFFKRMSNMLENLIKEADKEGNTSDEKIKATIKKFFANIPSVYQIDEVNSQNIDDLHKITSKGWGNAKISKESRQSIYSSWHRKNNKVFLLIKDKNTDDLIGYICVLPLHSEEHFTGVKSKFSIHWSEIVDIDESANDKVFIYVESLFVLPKYQSDVRLAMQIYQKLIEKICQFMGKGEAIIYADSKYRSLDKALSKLGFGYGNKIEKHSQAKYIPLFNGKEVNPSNHNLLYEKYYVKGKCGSKHNENKILFHSIAFISHQIMELKRREWPEKTFDEMLKVQLAKFNKNEDSEQVKVLLGKSFLVCFHTTNSESSDSGRDKTHFFTTATLSFVETPNKNYIYCTLLTFTKRGQGKFFKYRGITFFGQKFQEMLLCLYPFKESTDGINWHKYDRQYDIYPIIIRGGFISEISNNSKFIPLNYSYYSFQSKTHLSKIALLTNAETLGIKDMPQSIPLIIKEPYKSDLKTAMKFLMRSNKVSISTINFEQEGSVEAWMESKFTKRLGLEKDKKFLLLYYKRDDQGQPLLSYATLEFYNNGIVKLEREYSTRNLQGDKVKRKDTYYGEFNLRHKIKGQEYIYLKLIQMNPDEEGDLHQYYRELFVILFWPTENDDKEFDFTRGLITSDKDHEESIGTHSMSSNICLLCQINHNWKLNFEIEFPFNETEFDRAKDKIRCFLNNVIQDTIQPFGGKLDYGSIDMIFDKKFCSYKAFLGPC